MIKKEDVINVEFKGWEFENINNIPLNLNQNNQRSLYKLSFINWNISKYSIINIAKSINNLSQIDLSENGFHEKAAQLICDELSYLDFIYMFKNEINLSNVKSPNLII